MSWTSEFEPSASHSDIDDDPHGDADDLVMEGFSLVNRPDTADADGEPPEDIRTDVSAPMDVPDEGPLDPSIFDGLFADLATEGDAAKEDPGDHTVDDPDHEPPPDDDEGHGDPDPADQAEQTEETDPADQADDVENVENVENEGEAAADADADRDADHPDEPDHADPADRLPGFEPGGPSNGATSLPGEDGGAEPEHLPANDRRPAQTVPGDPGQERTEVDLRSPPGDPAGDPTADSMPEGFDLEMARSLFDTGDVTGRTGPGRSTTDATDDAEYQTAGHVDNRGDHPQALGLTPTTDRNGNGNAHRAGDGPPGRVETKAIVGLDPSSIPEPVPDGGGSTDPALDERPAGVGRSSTARRWPAFAVATLIGAGLGIGGALVLSQVINEPDIPGSTEAVQQATVSKALETTPVNASAPAADSAAPAPIAEVMAGGGLELNTIRFVPGTLTLTDGSLATLSEVAAEAAELPPAPLAVAVRSYSEQTAAENLTLSIAQAEVIVDYLTGLGTSAELVTGTGLGAPLLTTAQPVPNFVAVNAGLQPSALRTTVEGLAPFAIGLDPATGGLRPESIEPLNILGRAMASDPDGSVSLAAYAHSGTDQAANRALATAAVDAVADHLVDGLGIDPARLSILTPGQAPYVVATAAGNHISLRWGTTATEQAEVAAIEPTAISFTPGSARIDDDAAQALDRLIEIVSPGERTVVIEVHTATEASAAANLELGRSQAEAIQDHLTDGGLPASRIRAFGSGNLRQFRAGDQDSLVVVTVVP